MQKARITIALDIDGTIADMLGRLREVVYELGIRPKEGWEKVYDLQYSLEIDKEKLEELFIRTWADRSKVKPLEPNLNERINRLHQKYNIIILTSNHYASQETLIAWLNENKIAYDGFYIVETPFEKARHKADIIIEDYGEAALHYVKVNKRSYAILIAQPYNEAYANVNDRIYRVTWADVESKISEIEKLLRKEKR